MIRLPSVFSSGALFQQNSTLTIRGYSDRFSVTVRLMLDNRTIEETTSVVSGGCFEAEIATPAASMQAYTISLSDGEELLLENILFGELWLASGQSNMSFTNASMFGCDAYLDTLRGLPIRTFVQHYPELKNQAEFPRQPSDALSGHWCDADDSARMRAAFACGTAFLKELTHYFRDRIPVGILNAAWGGTPMLAWLPEDAVLADTVLCPKLAAASLFPVESEWNQKGEGNKNQPYCQYNLKIAPLLGVRIRGIIWYQGESDTGAEFDRRIYSAYLHCYHTVYSQRFAADPLNFMMISSLLYPWSYGVSGETNIGVLNQTFIDIAVREPHKFAFVPIGDLPPIWSHHTGNHPIHPCNKYDIGYRMALLAETNSYDRGSQRTPATMMSCERDGSRLLIRFRHASSGLHIHGDKLRGIYVAGKDNLYLAAQSEIVAPDTIAVWHPYLTEPVHAAYGYSSFEEGCNLFAGELPAAPFATDTENRIRIECKPWLDPATQRVWALNPLDKTRDVFYHPVWHTTGESEICTDPAFTRTGLSLRICSSEEIFGAYVKSHPYNRLDLQNYTALKMHMYCAAELDPQLVLSFAEGDPLTLPIKHTESLGDGWDAYEVCFDGLPEADITRMTFRFHGKQAPYFVNMEALTLVPRQ